jgi:hypothetical protein
MCDVWTVSSWQERSFFASQASRSPSQPSHNAGCPARPRLRRRRDGLLVTLALAIGAIVGKRAATLARRPANNAVGRCLVPWITRT